MKRIVLCAVFVSLVATPNIVFAGSGSAYVPVFHVHSQPTFQFRPFLHITNITDESLTVTVTFFGRNGVVTDVDDDPALGVVRASNVVDYSDTLGDQSAEFTLEAHQQGLVYLEQDIPPTAGTQPSDFGYALIEWEKKDEAILVGLIAQMVHIQTIFFDEGSMPLREFVPINGGRPF